MQNLLALMQHLRQNCAWDKQQTSQSLTPYAIEEAYEVEQAVRSGNIDAIKEELGDLLLQVVFQAQIYSEQNAFDFHDVVRGLEQKLIRRHPHVFHVEQYADYTPQQMKQLWQDIKQQEKQQKLSTMNDEQRRLAGSILAQVKYGSALTQAQSVQHVAQQIGFDFPDLDSAYAKLDEELTELQHAIIQQQQQEIEQEFGDCLFALINVGRKLGISSEMALLGTITKFRQRFAIIEQQAQLQGRKIEDLTLAEMDKLWDYAKTYEKSVD